MAQFPSALQVPRLIRILERDCRGIKHADFNPDLPCLFFRRQNIEAIMVTQTFSATILISTQNSLFYLAKTRCVTSASLLLLRSVLVLGEFPTVPGLEPHSHGGLDDITGVLLVPPASRGGA